MQCFNKNKNIDFINKNNSKSVILGFESIIENAMSCMKKKN